MDGSNSSEHHHRGAAEFAACAPSCSLCGTSYFVTGNNAVRMRMYGSYVTYVRDVRTSYIVRSVRVVVRSFETAGPALVVRPGRAVCCCLFVVFCGPACFLLVCAPGVSE